jgi:hypothetical protein
MTTLFQKMRIDWINSLDNDHNDIESLTNHIYEKLKIAKIETYGHLSLDIDIDISAMNENIKQLCLQKALHKAGFGDDLYGHIRKNFFDPIASHVEINFTEEYMMDAIYYKIKIQLISNLLFPEEIIDVIGDYC